MGRHLGRFSFPVIYTTTGHITIEAKTKAEAMDKARELNEQGVEYTSIEDADCQSEVLLNEIEIKPAISQNQRS